MRIPSAFLLLVLAAVLPAQAQDPKVERIERFEYQRLIEWGGDNLMTKLVLVRQADGSYLADIAGEDSPATRSGVRVEAAAIKDLEAALAKMLSFPDDSFAGDGNHWITKFDVKGALEGGKALAFKRDFYDPSSNGLMRQVNAFDEVAAALIKKIAALPAQAPPANQAAPAGGIAGQIGPR